MRHTNRSEIERVYTKLWTRRARGSCAILNSKYAHRVTSALVSQKICCLQACDGVFTCRVQMQSSMRTYSHRERMVHRGFHVHPLESVSKRRRAIEMQTSGISCVLSSSRSVHLLLVLHFKGRHDTCFFEFERAPDSDERQTRVSDYSFKNYSYSSCAFKRFE